MTWTRSARKCSTSASTWPRCRRLQRLVPFHRGVLFAWGFAKGFTSGRHSVAEAARRTALRRYEWSAVILDDSTPVNEHDPEGQTIGEYNVSIYGEFLREFRAVGVKAGGWTTEGGSIFMVPSHSDLAIAEIEGPGDYDGVRNVLAGAGAGPIPTCSLGTVTNFSTLDRAKVRLLLEAGFTMLPEAYMNENPAQTPDNMDRLARSLGAPTSQPVAGVYPNPVSGHVADYSPWADWPLIDYLGEYVI